MGRINSGIYYCINCNTYTTCKNFQQRLTNKKRAPIQLIGAPQ